mgnify:FL=1|jgi:acyl carrier protein
MSNIENEIEAILNEVVQLDRLNEINNLVTGGHLDSFDTLALISKIEDKYDISIEFTEDVFSQLDSISNIKFLIRNALKAN